MEIRRVMPGDDFRAIARIYSESWKAAYRGIVPQAYLDALTEARWATVLAGSAYDALVLMDGEAYAGTSSVCAARDTSMAGWGEIISLYLLPPYWGKGHGAALMDAAIALLGEKGFDRMYLWVLEDNARARAFYEKRGFVVSPDRAEIEIGGKALAEVRYTKGGRGFEASSPLPDAVLYPR